MGNSSSSSSSWWVIDWIRSVVHVKMSSQENSGNVVQSSSDVPPNLVQQNNQVSTINNDPKPTEEDYLIKEGNSGTENPRDPSSNSNETEIEKMDRKNSLENSSVLLPSFNSPPAGEEKKDNVPEVSDTLSSNLGEIIPTVVSGTSSEDISPNSSSGEKELPNDENKDRDQMMDTTNSSENNQSEPTHAPDENQGPSSPPLGDLESPSSPGEEPSTPVIDTVKEIPNNGRSGTTTATKVGNIASEDEQEQEICSICVDKDSNQWSTCDSTVNEIIDQTWLSLQFVDTSEKEIRRPDYIEKLMKSPSTPINDEILDRLQGSIIGMALGDALGAHVEFRPRQFLLANPVKDLQGGGTWGLDKGQFTDDTSMALCLANSLIVCRDFVPYDQLVRYKWWYKHGYMSSTGKCFDIGNATRQSIEEFQDRQKKFASTHGIDIKKMDSLSDLEHLKKFNVHCSYEGVAGNGALMRLAPVPLFFYRFPKDAVEFSGQSGLITHGDRKAVDACRYYGALIIAALRGHKKDELLSKHFYSRHKAWFGTTELHPAIESIAKGSYQNPKGYDGGIRGKGYIVSALEAALWAFWSDENSFEKGALAAVNLGDDTDTTAAIYGQLAGAYYGYKNLPKKWCNQVYAQEFLKTLSKWIAYGGECWKKAEPTSDGQ